MKEPLYPVAPQTEASQRISQEALTREYIDSLRSEIVELRRQLQSATQEKSQLLQLVLDQAGAAHPTVSPPPVAVHRPPASVETPKPALTSPAPPIAVPATKPETPPKPAEAPIWQPVRRAKALADDEIPVPLLVRRYVQEVNNHRIPQGHAELRPMWEWLQWQGMVLDRQNRESARETLKRMRKQIKG